MKTEIQREADRIEAWLAGSTENDRARADRLEESRAGYRIIVAFLALVLLGYVVGAN